MEGAARTCEVGVGPQGQAAAIRPRRRRVIGPGVREWALPGTGVAARAGAVGSAGRPPGGPACRGVWGAARLRLRGA